VQESGKGLDVTPDYFFKQEQYTIRKSVKVPYTPMETVIFILANLDLLGRRHHPYYQNSIIVDPTMNTFCNDDTHSFAIDEDTHVLDFFISIIRRFLPAAKEDNEKVNNVMSESSSYFLIVSLRLLKINLFSFITSCSYSAFFQKIQNTKCTEKIDEKLLSSLSQLLLAIVKSNNQTLFPSTSTIKSSSKGHVAPSSETIARVIKKEAVHVLVVGFTVFFKRPTDQIEFLLQLFQESQEGNESSQLLLSTLLPSLANWHKLFNLLLDDGEIIE